MRLSPAPKKILLLLFVLSLALIVITFGLYEYGVALNLDNNFALINAIFWGLLISWAQYTAVKLPLLARISHSYLFILSTILLFPPWVPPILVFTFFLSAAIKSEQYTWYKDLFNRLQTAVSAGLATFAYLFIYFNANIIVAGIDLTLILAVVIAATVYYIANMSLVATAISATSGIPFKDVWFHNFGWLLVSYLLMTPVIILLSRMYVADPPLLGNWGGWAVILFLIPLYYARFHWDEVVKLREAFNKTVDLLSNTIDAKDSHTFLHSERVTAIASALARAYGLDAAQINTIEKGSRIHDIGKIGIPDAVLFKPGSLTEEEYNIIKKHPEYGVRLLEPASDYLSETFDIIKYHHERWDGRGYPEGLAGQEIPLWARIVGLADAYEAMTAGRPYQKAKTPEDALREIEDLAGIQFDPKLVRLFREIWETNPAWRDREVFLRLYSSKVPSLESSSPPSLEREPETSQKSS